jgi:DNA repair exonuclease SbcCD ATPase subunit
MSLANAKKVVRDLKLTFKALEYAEEALTELDTLEQAKGDLSKDVKDLADKKQAAELELNAVLIKVKENKEQIDKDLDRAKEKAAKILEDAAKKERALLEKAEAKLADVEATIAKYEGEYKKAQALIAENEKVEAELNKRKAELDEVTSKVAALLNLKG